MKMRFKSDDNLLLNKILKLDNLTVVVRSVFQEDGKNYPQIFFRGMFAGIIKVQHNLKQINIKNYLCYFFNDMINIKVLTQA